MASTLPYGLKPPLTAEEYSELPEVPGFKDELIEGERVLTAMPKLQHSLVIERLERLLKEQFPGKHVLRESGWYFKSADGLESIPGPDLMVLEEEEVLRSARSSAYFEGHPLFVVEVISPSERRSRRAQKIALYLEAGAAAVVEVNYTNGTVLVDRPDKELPDVCNARINWPFQASFQEIFSTQ